VIGRSVACVEDLREVAPIAAVAGLRMASPWCRPDVADADGAVEVDDAVLPGDADAASAIAPWSRCSAATLLLPSAFVVPADSVWPDGAGGSESELGRRGGAPHSSSEIGLRGISAPASGVRLGGRALCTPGRSECTACPSRRRFAPVWCSVEGRRVRWADHVCFVVEVCSPMPAEFELLDVFGWGVGSDKVLEKTDLAPTPLDLRLAWSSLATWLGPPRMSSISSSDSTPPCSIAAHLILLLCARSLAHSHTRSLPPSSLARSLASSSLVSPLVAKGSLILDAPAGALTCQRQGLTKTAECRAWANSWVHYFCSLETPSLHMNPNQTATEHTGSMGHRVDPRHNGPVFVPGNLSGSATLPDGYFLQIPPSAPS
jgi:hypothetical protein